MNTESLFPEVSGATFSPCGRYRYALWRIWNTNIAPLAFIMLNPSTADAVDNDPTVERCVRRAMSMGYGGIRIANIFALRSTDPALLYCTEDPIGPDNDVAILEAAQASDKVVCAWGGHGKHLDRGVAVRRLLLGCGITPYLLVQNSDGTPKHPLYVSYSIQPEPWL